MKAMNNMVQKIKGFQHMDLNCGTNVIRQGSLVAWDSTNKVIKEAASDAECAKLLGVAMDTVPVASNIDNGVTSVPKTMNAGYNDMFNLNTTVGETYENFTPVYMGADAQTVTTVAGTNQIGYVRLASGKASVTGAAGVMVPVYVFSNYPVVSA